MCQYCTGKWTCCSSLALPSLEWRADLVDFSSSLSERLCWSFSTQLLSSSSTYTNKDKLFHLWLYTHIFLHTFLQSLSFSAVEASCCCCSETTCFSSSSLSRRNWSTSTGLSCNQHQSIPHILMMSTPLISTILLLLSQDMISCFTSVDTQLLAWEGPLTSISLCLLSHCDINW